MSNDDSNTRDIELSVELNASPEEVFRAVTDGTELAKWLAPEARVTPPSDGKPGQIWISWGEGMSVEKPVEIWDAPRRIRYRSGENPETKAPLWADWSIEAKAGGTTTLRLVHSGFSASADWDGEFEAHARGWKLMLENLRHYFARHPKKSAAHVIFSSQAKTEHGAAWTALLSKGAMGFESTPKPGDSYRITTSAGDALSGKVEIANGRDLALTVNELDDALLRVSLEGGSKPGSSTFVFGYVIAYGSEASRARELAENMNKVVSTLS
jgi:uncharacterized protein YndB with AHSA1/START domain